MLFINKAQTNDLILIEKLAYSIWNEHYTPIIGAKQVAYMLHKFQCVAAMKNQIEEGYVYYKVEHSNELIGYFAIQFREEKDQEECFISKVYLSKDSRGKGHGKKMFHFIEKKAKENNVNILKLTVNKYNSDTIKMYHQIGFITAREVVFEIGNGFIMDDFELKKLL